MEITDKARELYRDGEVVRVTKEVVDEQLKKAEDALGLENRKHDLKLFLGPEREMIEKFGAMGGSNYQKMQMALPYNSHEGTILHEATHIVMGVNGLVFEPDTDEWFFYEPLINETFAEGVTGEVYGLIYSDQVDGLRDYEEISPEIIELAIGKGGADLASRLSIRHRLAEIEYVKSGKSSEFGVLIRRWADTFPKDRYDEEIAEQERIAITFLATSNAYRMNEKGMNEKGMNEKGMNEKGMNEKGIKIEDLANDLREYVRNGKGAKDFYFEKIVPRVLER